MQRREVRGDAKAEAAARHPFVEADAAPDHGVALRLRQPRPVVGDGGDHLAARHGDRDGNAAACPLARIFHDVAEQLRQVLRVHPDACASIPRDGDGESAIGE